MSKRRNVGDVVLIQDKDEGPYLGRIDARGEERQDECPQCSFDPNHDQECREWPNVEILDVFRQATGQFVYHISECEMEDEI